MEFHGYTGISPTKLYHTSKTLVTQLEQRAQRVNFKPKGLWYSIGGAWIEWMQSEMPSWYTAAAHLYEVELSPDARIVRLTSERDLAAFEDGFSVDDATTGRIRSIDWERVAGLWDGIEFSPYVWSARMKYMWYSMVDVPSGCVWNTDAARVRHVASR